ncbi:MAG: TauD/TfdA family dioxygenase [Alphaproteobacteria bacterium]|jgi:taurine dioxygenase|nr:TauD/TfdA family dioxygenase [Alphaproteobacteria bacterium]
MEVRRIGETFFAEVDDVDVSKGFDAAEWQAFYNAYLEHQVLVLHGQTLSAAQFHALGERFGLVEPHTVSMYHHYEFKGITVLSNRTEMGRPKGIRDAGSSWHSDYSYKPVPANATMLYALEIPDAGGDTIFADLAAAYSALSDEKKASLEGLRVRQQYRWSRDKTHVEARWNLLNETEREKTPEVVHPLVRTHPETGRKGLFISNAVSTGIKDILDLAPDASQSLIEELFAHTDDPRFQVRHKWQVGDLVIWDNRTLMHKATTDVLPPDKFRTLYRINTTGTAPY